ncbi:MAG: hypothetical protein JXB23_17975 [Candidatus Aminicenantes bacterium]|nr:hypothetical protein [Candidatus Aminicenantes bacterium]
MRQDLFESHGGGRVSDENNLDWLPLPDFLTYNKPLRVTVCLSRMVVGGGVFDENRQ